MKMDRKLLSVQRHELRYAKELAQRQLDLIAIDGVLTFRTLSGRELKRVCKAVVKLVDLKLKGGKK